MKAFSVLININGVLRLVYVSATCIEEAKCAASNRFGGVAVAANLV